MFGRVPVRTLVKLMESPALIARGARHAYRKRVTSRMDYKRSDGYSELPIQIDLKIVETCNLRCKMCAQWGDAGYNFQRPGEELRQMLPLEVYQRMVDDMQSANPWYYIWGGEPFLYPHLVPLVRYMKEKGSTVSIVTNGTKLAADAEELVACGTDVILVSVDGPREIHDVIRGCKGAFDMTVEGIRAVQAERERQNKVRPFLAMMTVMTPENQNYLEQVYEIAESMEIDMMLTWFGWYQTLDSGMRQTAILQKKLNIVPWSWKGYMWGAEKIDPAKVRESVGRVRRRSWSFTYNFFPSLQDEEIVPYYTDHKNTFGYDHCRAPWVMAEILPNGDVATCRDYPDVVTGNIQRDSLRTIWNNDRSRAFRMLLKEEGGLLPICTRCQGLTGL